MVAGPCDARGRTGVAHRETPAGDTREVALAGDGAVQHRVADDDVVCRFEAALRRGRDGDAAAGQALADVVVGLPDERPRYAPGEEPPESLAGRALELDPARIRRQARLAVTPA